MKQGKISKLIVCMLALAMLFSSFTFSFGADKAVEIKSVTSGRKSITIKWKKVSGVHHYIITKQNGKTVKKGKDDTSYKNINLPSNETFKYIITAYDKNGKVIAETKGVKGTTKGVGIVKKMEANSGYKSITISFKKVKNANYYQIQKWDPKKKKWRNIINKKGQVVKLNYKRNKDKYIDKTYLTYRDAINGFDIRRNSDKEEMVRNKTYKYRVRAWRKTSDGIWWASQKWTIASAKPTRQMYQNIKVNGRWHVANGYSGGTYYTTEGNAYSVTSISRAKCDYSETKNYSRRSAENFVNELMKAGKYSRRGKSKLIWISTYTQHIYVFKWKNKRWQLDRGWECSTGKEGSPTPMGFDKYIHNKTGYRRGIRYWSFFQTLNALHGLGSYSDHSGEPMSGGCVRNPDYRAEWIYENCSTGTPVISW